MMFHYCFVVNACISSHQFSTVLESAFTPLRRYRFIWDHLTSSDGAYLIYCIFFSTNMEGNGLIAYLVLCKVLGKDSTKSSNVQS
jgi:hypothetical protein